MKRRFFLILAVLSLLPPGIGACRADAADAQQLVKDTTDQLLARLERDRETLRKNPDQIYTLVEDIVLPHFDFTRMSQWVLGKYWRSADAKQRTRFTEEFRILLVRTYATALLEYTDQTVRYLPFHAPDDAKTVTVKTEIVQSTGGPPIPLHYSLYRNKSGEWKVYDIAVEGVSLVTNYRSSFAADIREKGLDSLIDRLTELNARGEAADNG